MIQFKPLVSQKFYERKWFREKLDLSKLAKKRWIEGNSNHDLAKMLNLSPITIEKHLRRLKSSDKLAELDLTEIEAFQIRSNW